MKLRRANKVMMERHRAKLLSGATRLPGDLSALLAAGLAERSDCVFLAVLLEKSASVRQDDFPDKTGYECFVNHVHIDDYAGPSAVAVAVAFLGRLSEVLASRYVGYSFRGLLSEDENGVTVRIHRARLGEQWLSIDLEGYVEGVCEYDLTEIPAR